MVSYPMLDPYAEGRNLAVASPDTSVDRFASGTDVKILYGLDNSLF